jgi:hypothetical protein
MKDIVIQPTPEPPARPMFNKAPIERAQSATKNNKADLMKRLASALSGKPSGTANSA